MRYNNYHKHSHYSNLRTLDSITKPIDYINRAKELGHNTYFTTEHGYQGNIFEAYTLCQENDIKCIYGVEAYYVDDIYDKTDRRNFHIMLIAKTESGRFQINKIMSIANTEGFYYKPRIDLKLLLSLNSPDVIVTTACIASRMFKGEDTDEIIGYHKKIEEITDYSNSNGFCGWYGSDLIKTNEDDLNRPIYKQIPTWEEKFFIPVFNHFKDNFYLEVQCHNENIQIEYNKKILEVAKQYNVQIIHANDSHYIKPEDAQYRDLFLKAKGINYADESNFILDYPDYDTIVERYKEQGILSEEQIYQALNNTLIFDSCEGITLDKAFKIPKIFKGDSNKKLQNIICSAWKKEKENIKSEKWDEYKQAILYEYNIIKDCHMADYFILDNAIVNRAVNKYNAVLTRSGRGSAVSFYNNKLLGLTEVDRLKAPITLYPTRFMSAERILQSRSIPDIDLNFADVTPVIQASKDILGEDGIYYMIAYKPLQESSAFRLWCKAIGKNIDDYNDIAKEIEKYYEDPNWEQIIKDSQIFQGVIESVAPSSCSFLMMDKPISKEIGLIKVGEEICCCLDGYNCDVYKYLKNDYLTVKVYSIISEVYKLIDRPIDDIATLVNNCDEKVWDIYAKALTTTINQADSDFAKQTLKRYKPHSLSELSAWVASIRPGFASLLNIFLDRQPYTTGVEELDYILKDSFHYMIYQESIMKYLVWLGIDEKITYDIIKKISKKKFKEEELNELKEKLLIGWKNNVSTEEGFEETWQVVMDAARYSFNASHSLSVAIDSLYGAYLKANYPLEYYTVVLNLYSNDSEKTTNLIDELPYFNIEIKPIKFGKSLSEYAIDKENNSIYKGIASIKFCNSKIADELMELSKNKYNSFIELLIDISTKTSVDSRQLEILTGLNFFLEFGKNKYLLDCIKIYNQFYKNKKPSKQINKKKLEELGLTEYMMKKYSGKETESLYKDLDLNGIMNELISKLENKSMSVIEQVKFEMEYLEYAVYTNTNVSDKFYIVTEFKTYKDKTKPYLTLRNIKTGNEIKTKIKKGKIFVEYPFNQFSVLKLNSKSLEEQFKSKLVNGVWGKSDETEQILVDYQIIK